MLVDLVIKSTKQCHGKQGMGKKKEHKLYGAFAKDVDMNAKGTKITFDDSDSD